MFLLPNTLIELAAAGASFRLSARDVSGTQLNQLAANVAASGGQITLLDADQLSPAQAKTLLELAPKSITFDLTKA